MKMLSLLTWALLGEEDGYSPMTISLRSLMNWGANRNRVAALPKRRNGFDSNLSSRAPRSPTIAAAHPA